MGPKKETQTPTGLPRGRARVERELGGKKGLFLTYFPELQETRLEECALEALPTGTDDERAEFKRYWRDQIRRNRAAMDSPAFADAAQSALVATATPKKANATLLKGKEYVPVHTACSYLGVGRRAVEYAMKKGSLTSQGRSQNRKISTDSLLKYLPPEETTK
jgi:hypothetical protein